MSIDRPKPSPKKPVQTDDTSLSLPVPPPKEPGLITSFINMVDIAEALEAAEESKRGK
jgi:hypothetical protein